MSLLFNMLFSLVITFLLRSKHLLISWLQSPSAVILEPPKIKSVTVSTVSPSICLEVMGPDAMILLIKASIEGNYPFFEIWCVSFVSKLWHAYTFFFVSSTVSVLRTFWLFSIVAVPIFNPTSTYKFLSCFSLCFKLF